MPWCCTCWRRDRRQIEAELGDVPEAAEASEEVPEAVGEAAPAADEQLAG